MAVEADNFMIETKSINILQENANLFVKFELKPIKINNALFYENKDSLSLGIRKCQKHGKEVIEEWGIIIESGKNTKDTTKATIWLKADRKLLAMHGSGIIPIFKDTERKSLFFTDTEAPLNGYFFPLL